MIKYVKQKRTLSSPYKEIEKKLNSFDFALISLYDPT